jgi:antitoxin HicB
MKTVEDYMKLNYRMQIVEDPYEGGYVVSFPELPGCITCAETIEEALELAEDAKRVWFEAAIEDEYEIPDPNFLDNYSGQFKLRLPKSLHHSLSENAKKEGISMNQYCLYLLSMNNALHTK